jgi:LuxR family quorum sensing-dependent transcriptional regulator
MFDPEYGPLTNALEVIDSLSRVEDSDELLACAASALGQFGFSAFVLTRLPRPAAAVEPQFLLNGWPPAWGARYEEAGHLEFDPVARHCMTSGAAFDWTELPAAYVQSQGALRVLREAGEFGLTEGICVPLHTPLGVGGLSLAGAHIEPVRGLKHIAMLFAHRLCDAVERVELSNPGGASLTARERDVLSWVACGKTVQDIATILAISDHTVGEHLKHVRRKLGTSNSAHSIVRALQLGQLRL